jgi:hypothetical protein
LPPGPAAPPAKLDVLNIEKVDADKEEMFPGVPAEPTLPDTPEFPG